MNQGYAIVTRNSTTNYKGIDASWRDDVWRDLDTWNEENPSEIITLENGNPYSGAISKPMIPYFHWQKKLRAGENTFFLYFKENTLEISALPSIFGISFQLIGYDCIYLEIDESGDYGTVSFSSLANEMHISKLADHRRYVNTSGLFNNPEMAYKYIELREILLSDPHTNLETAFTEYEMKVIATFEVTFITS